MQPDLPETYYLDNVRTLFDHVESVYADILDDELASFLETFAALGDDAQKLCIRLLNRRHDWFRRSKIDYPEIGAIDAAIDELAAAALIEVDGEIEPVILLSLYTKPELLACAAGPAVLGKLRRDELESALLNRNDDQFFARLRDRDRLLCLLCGDQYLQCQMLFFGNLNQSMTDFVLRDLGLYQYEAYPLDAAHRPYRDLLEIRQHWLLYQLESLFEICDRGNAAQLLKLADMIPDDIDAVAPAWRKGERLRYEVARQLERLDAVDAALDLYRCCVLPPARERIARILDRQGDPGAARDLCLGIVASPLDESELQFARAFVTRLARRHGFNSDGLDADDEPPHQPPIVELELEPHDSVELAVAEHFDGRDAAEHCYYLENSLFNGVLGLLLWEVVFAPVPGAFYNPFQHRPSDFYAHDFCARRRDLLQQLWDGIDDNSDIAHIVGKRWKDKYGLMNPLVNWQALDPDIISLALELIDHAHWRAIFDRILADLRNNRAGFPDLLHFPPDGSYCLVEVKGPGDSLQKNQQRWMQYFRQHGIPHRIARVTWKNA